MNCLFIPGVILSGLYILFAGQISVSECIAAALAVGGAWIFVRVETRAAERSIGIGNAWQHFRRAAPGRALIRDSVIIARMLAREILAPSAGEVGTLSTIDVSKNDADSYGAGSKAGAIVGHSLAPNGIVVDLDDQAADKHGTVRLLVHRLGPA